MNIPDEATMAAYDALCAIYWPDTQTYDVATADLDTVSETVYTVLEAAMPHIRRQLAEEIRALIHEPGICDLCRGGNKQPTTSKEETPMSEPKVVFEAVPSRWRVENRIRDGKWVGDQCFPTLAAATIYAQKWLDNNPDVYAYSVVDTQPEEVAAVGANLQWSKPSDLAEMSINAHQLTVPLTLDAYQEQAKATAVYPYEKADQYLIAGLAGEVGELASIFAKHWRGDGDLNPDHAAAELGDVLWFVAMLADDICCNLSDVAQNNLNKLADRANRGKLKGNGDNR